MFELPWTAADMSPTDLIRPGRAGDGFTEAKYIDLGRLTNPMLQAWAESVLLTEGPSGIAVKASNALGRELLAAFEIPDGARILAINSLLTKDNPNTGEPGGTVWEAVSEVDRVIKTGGIVVLILDGPDGTRHLRYIVTSASAMVAKAS
jgi:hypothetical protein